MLSPFLLGCVGKLELQWKNDDPKVPVNWLELPIRDPEVEVDRFLRPLMKVDNPLAVDVSLQRYGTDVIISNGQECFSFHYLREPHNVHCDVVCEHKPATRRAVDDVVHQIL